MSSDKHLWHILCAQETISEGDEIHLEEGEHHYVHHVLRLVADTEIEVSNGMGFLGKAVIVLSSKKHTRIRITFAQELKPPVRPIHLVVGMPKPSTLEEVVATCSEIGATVIHIVKCDKTPIKTAPKLEKLKKVALESTRINKSPFAAEIRWHDSVNEAIKDLSHCQTVLFCDEKLPFSPADSLASALANQKFYDGSTVAIVVGPEASFSTEERNNFLKSSNIKAISLGQHILRVPTACAVSLGAVCLWVWGR